MTTPALASPEAQAVRLARVELCRFLSACWCQPEPAFAEERLFESMCGVATHIDPETAAAARRLADAFESQDLQALLVDYTRLLLGPTHPRARPYGSCWLDGEPGLMRDSTLAVAGLYRQAGFQIDEAAAEAPDHVALELEFLYLLMHRLAQPAAGDAQATLALLQSLLREHLGAWIEAFSAAVELGAETAFYRELATLTRRFVQQQAAALADG